MVRQRHEWVAYQITISRPMLDRVHEICREEKIKIAKFLRDALEEHMQRLSDRRLLERLPQLVENGQCLPPGDKNDVDPSRNPPSQRRPR
jgi:hypothetical protein